MYNVKLRYDHGKKLADFYHSAPHEPNHPEVKEAYDALIKETIDQFQDMLNKGFRFSVVKPGQEYPYKNSKDLHDDIEKNKHIWLLPTMSHFGHEFGLSDHPLLSPTKFKIGDHQLVANDIFCLVHDYRGHYLGGRTTFGPKGEHQAFLQHKKDFSPVAQKALAAETLLQNSWVNFGPHGEHNRKNPAQTIYAEQKAIRVPDWVINTDWHSE